MAIKFFLFLITLIFTNTRDNYTDNYSPQKGLLYINPDEFNICSPFSSYGVRTLQKDPAD